MIVQQTLIDVTCGSCGIQFGLPDFYWQRREKDGATWPCTGTAPMTADLVQRPILHKKGPR